MIKTLGDAIKQYKKLLSTLGIEYWCAYLSESRYFKNNPTYTEDSKIEPVCGDHYKMETCLIVSDPIELVLVKEGFFLFVVGEEE